MSPSAHQKIISTHDLRVIPLLLISLICVNCINASIYVPVNKTSSSATTYQNNDSNILPPDVDSALSHAPSGRSPVDTVVRSWSLLLSRANIWSKDFAEAKRQTLRQIYRSNNNISTDCRESLDGLLNSIQNLDDWAIKCKFTLRIMVHQT